MGLKTIYSKYFQKSKVFIYPLLGIKRGNSVIPVETYICWDGHYTSEDMRLICLYDTKDSPDYRKFESTILAKHTRLVDFVKNNEQSIFVFDFSDLEESWDHFVNGKYSKLSANTKNKILKFFDKNSGNYAYMYSYLMPEKHFERYADILGVDEEFLRKVGELCNKPDIEKETLVFEIADLDNLDKQIKKQKPRLWQNKKQ
jgi:hypothetical protein